MHPEDYVAGHLLALVLAQSWQSPPLENSLPADVIEPSTALLLTGGAAALVWRRLQSAAPQYGDVLAPFPQAYTYYTIRAGFHEAQARSVFAFFRANDIEPVLVKGWSIARRYPAKGL